MEFPRQTGSHDREIGLMGTSNVFKYEALPRPQSQIRLLQVQNAAEDEPICCYMHVFDVEQAPEYAAISYTWGDTTQKESIYVNDSEMKVGKNCRYALWQRSQFQNPGSWTWIDSLCVNQGNLVEKSHQVQMMGDIFQKAESVVVSLEDDDGRAECIAYYSDQLAIETGDVRVRETSPSYWRTVFPDPRERRLTQTFVSRLDQPILRGIERILAEFSRKSYWSRLWVVQELKLARRAQIVCGLQEMSLVHVDRLARAMCAAISMHSLYASPMLVLFRAIDPNLFSEGTHLEYECAWLSNLGCWDPRDRIYAMIRVFEWDHFQGPPIVDYGKSPVQLAIDMIERFGQSRSNLYKFTAEMLRILEIPRNCASKIDKTVASPTSLRHASSLSFHTKSTTCSCDRPSVASSPLPLVLQASTTVAEAEALRVLSNTITRDGFRSFGITREGRAIITPSISPNIRSTDRLISISSDENRFFILRQKPNGIYQIVGLATIYDDLIYSQLRYSNNDVALFLDVQDLVTLVRSTCKDEVCSEHGGSVDRLQYDALRASDWFNDQAFCRKRFSSFGVPRRMVSNKQTHSTVNMRPLCADCGLWVEKAIQPDQSEGF